MEALTCYYTRAKDGGLDMTEAFYKLGLKAKKDVIAALEAASLLDSPRTLHRIANALLQHSTPAAKADYPCQGIRKISEAALAADADELPYLIRKLATFDRITVSVLRELFEITETDLYAD